VNFLERIGRTFLLIGLECVLSRFRLEIVYFLLFLSVALL